MLGLDGLREAPHRHLTQVHLQQGHLTDAATRYERCRTALSRGLDVMSSGETLAVYPQLQSTE